MANKELKASILEVIDNQLRDKDPACTKETFIRLKESGYEEARAKEMMAAVLINEMYEVMKENKAFDEERYCKKLSELPGKIVAS